MNELGAGPCHEQWRQTRFSITRSLIATARSSLTRPALRQAAEKLGDGAARKAWPTVLVTIRAVVAIVVV
jgi:hypothetical protein